MCGRFVEINHAKQQINAFSGNLFIPLTNRHNLWIIIICKKCSVKSDHRNILRHPQTRIKIARMAPTAITSLMAKPL